MLGPGWRAHLSALGSEGRGTGEQVGCCPARHRLVATTANATGVVGGGGGGVAGLDHSNEGREQARGIARLLQHAAQQRVALLCAAATGMCDARQPLRGGLRTLCRQIASLRGEGADNLGAEQLPEGHGTLGAL